MSTATSNPYQIFSDLKHAGWFRDFTSSPGGFSCVPVADAPALGSHPGGVLFAGAWTAPDGTMMFQRSNMDRSITTVIIDPLGNILHSFWRASLVEACDHLQTLNLI